MRRPFVKYVKSFRAAALVAVIVGGAALAAQAPQEPPPGGWAFEVASIKPNNSGDGRVMMQSQPGRMMMTNVTLKMLVRQAYQLQDFQITGGPGWIASDHFDINAKMPEGFQPTPGPPPPGSGPGPIQLMLRGLLAERFKLAVHNETKDASIYALIVARSDGRLGPQLKKSEADCTAWMTKADKNAFVDLPFRLYAGDPNWIPPLRMNQKELVGFARHPFYDNAIRQA